MISFLRTLFTLQLGLLLSVALMAQPANDDCANAIAIGSVADFAFTTIDATTGLPYHPAACTGGTADSLYNDVWYSFTADFTGIAEFTTCGTADFDTNIAAYAPGSSCPPTENDLLACNEDGAGCDGFTSKITFAVAAGQVYLLRIGGWGSGPPGEEGTGTFSVSEFVSTGPPPNDNCADAIGIGSVTDFAFSTLNATTDGPYHPDACTGGAADSLYNDVWYLYTADFTGTAEFTTCGTANFDTNLGVYAPGSSCPPTENDLLACNEDGAGCEGFTSKTTFDIVEGQVYLLRIGGWGSGPPGEEGTGTFTVGEFVPTVGPPNDECDNAIVLDLGPMDSVTFEFTTVDATTSDPFHETGPAGCLEAGEPVPYNDVWYSWTATFSGWIEYSNCGTANFDSKIAVYGPNQSCPPDVESLIACGDDGCPGFTSVVNFPVEQDSIYLLRMGAWSSSGAGIGTITVRRIPPPIPPANDFCVDYDTAWVTPFATADDFDPVFLSFTNNGSSEISNPTPGCINGNEYADVWFKFNSGNNTQLTLRLFKITEGSQFSIDLFDDCVNLTDAVAGPGFCLYTGSVPDDFFIMDVENFPGVPTDYFLRISTDLTFDDAGEFFIQILGESTTGIENVMLENFKFYPNPTSDRVNVQFDLEKLKEVSIEIFNTLGQVAQQATYSQLHAGKQQLQVSVADLQPGVYFLRLLLEEGQKTVRFVKN